MVGDRHLTADHRTLPHPAAPRHPGLTGNDHMRPDIGVVGDLHQVVDLRPAADPGLTQGRPVYAAVAADIHIVLDHHPPELRDLAMALPVPAKTETVPAQYRPRMDDTALPDAGTAVQGRIGLDHRVRPEGHPGAEVGARPDGAARSHPDPGRQHRAGAHRHPLAQRRARVEHRTRVNALHLGHRLKGRRQQEEAAARLRHPDQQGSVHRGEALMHQHRSGPRLPHRVRLIRPLREAQIGATGQLQGIYPANIIGV